MDNQILRHLIATLAYRVSKVIDSAPDTYPEFSAGAGVRSPIELLHHISGVLAMADSALRSIEQTQLPIADWPTEVTRFYDVLEQVDHALASDAQPQKLTW